MLNPPLRSATLLSCLLATAAAAQVPLDPNIGLALGAGDTTVSPNNALGFSFVFPDLSVQTMIDIDSNGRVFAPGADTSDDTETLSEFLGQASSICPFWDDLDPGSAFSDDVYFNAYHNGTQNVAVVTWKDVVLYNWHQQLAFTFQLQMFDDGRFAFVYDGRAPIDEPIVGVCSGNGAVNPGSTDFSSAASHNTGASRTIFEDVPFQTFDLQGCSLEFLPIGAGGYLVSYASRNAGARQEGVSRITGIDFAPDGAGGYTVSRLGASAFDPVFGASVLNTGDEVFASSNNLGFTFTWPGGTTSVTADAESNGRLLKPGSDATDYTPDVAELLGETHPTIAPLWNDFTFSQSATDDLFVKTGPGFATFTWSGVNQFRFTRPHTFQATLRSDGSFTFAYVTSATFDDAGGYVAAGDALVGCSAGFGALDPGESDFAAGGFATAGNPTVYEYWSEAERLDLQLRTVALTRPLLNGSYDLQVIGIPPGTSGVFLMIGFANLNLGPLDAIGMPSCFLYSSNNIPAVPLPFVGSVSGVLSLAIGSNPGSIGIPLVMQAATITPGASSLPVITSNAVVGPVGTL